ncbi:M13 family metallopeptidase [Nocardia sp. CS682]|uniref:M13 family metallopeptidase n=1 Tax=Nocardia sp. CS682 TaxID=1047172 RepID=UPI00107538D0|nr:M13 family metallopeptidase [Nocardia sp. CS682]QBS41295.1 endothelin-converting protein [Nocardia sp. CS682]
MKRREDALINRRNFLASTGLLLVGSSVPASTYNGGKELNGAGPAFRPQDDLYRYVNGKWLYEYQLPADRASQSSGEELAERIQLQLTELIKAIHDPLPGSIEQKIRDLYDAQLDIETRDQLGLSPIRDLLDAIDRAGTKQELAGAMAAISKELPAGKTQGAMGGLIGFRIVPDGGVGRPMLFQSGIRFDRAFYVSADQVSRRDAYRKFLARIASAADFADGNSRADAMLELESRIAGLHWDRSRSRDASATRNVIKYQQIFDSSPGFDWVDWTVALFEREVFGDVIVAQPSFMAAVGALWSEVDIDLWRNYLALGAIRDFCFYLGRPFSDYAFDFFGRAMSGLTDPPSDMASAVETVDKFLDHALGRKYVEAHFSEHAMLLVSDMVENIKDAYRRNFSTSAWMSDATKVAAIEKLDSMSARIGYPKVWPDCHKYEVSRGRLIGSIRAISKVECQHVIASICKPVDNSVWSIPSYRVEASYSRQQNRITLAAAVLQPPYFDPGQDAALNYGAIGSIIAHEIGHGFDDQGAKYDAVGNLRDWWTDQDRSAFEQKVRAVVDQYGRLTVDTSGRTHRVNGALTVGENIADIRGLTMALEAYYLESQKRGERLDFAAFFISYARRWRQKIRSGIANAATASSVHAPAEVRVNQVVRNTSEFHTVFDVRSTDRLYLPASERVSF